MIADADPSDAQTYMRIAEIDRRNGKFDQALEVLKKAKAIVPDSLEVQYNIAVHRRSAGQVRRRHSTILNAAAAKDRARRRPVHAFRRRTTAPSSWSGWERSIARHNKYQLSVDTFRKMLDLGDDSAVRGYQQMIETYRDNRQWQQATDDAAEAAKKFPDDRGLQMVAASQAGRHGQAGRRHRSSEGAAEGHSRRSRRLYRAGPDVQPAARTGTKPKRTSTRPSNCPPSRKTRITRCSCRLHLRAPEEVRSGGRGLPQGGGRRSPRTPWP